MPEIKKVFLNFRNLYINYLLQNIHGHQHFGGFNGLVCEFAIALLGQLGSSGLSFRFWIVFQSTPNVSTLSLSHQVLEAYSFCNRSQKQM